MDVVLPAALQLASALGSLQSREDQHWYMGM